MNHRILESRLSRPKRPLFTLTSRYLKRSINLVPNFTRINSDNDVEENVNNPASLSIVFLRCILSTKQSLMHLLRHTDLLIVIDSLYPQIEDILNQYTSTRDPVITLPLEQAVQIVNNLSHVRDISQIQVSVGFLENGPSESTGASELNGESPSSRVSSCEFDQSDSRPDNADEIADHTLPHLVRESLSITGRVLGIQASGIPPDEPIMSPPANLPNVFVPALPDNIFPYSTPAINFMTMFLVEQEFFSDDESSIDQKLRLHALKGYQVASKSWISNRKEQKRTLKVSCYNLGLTGMVTELGSRAHEDFNTPEARLVKDSLSTVSALLNYIVNEKVYDHVHLIMNHLAHISQIEIPIKAASKKILIRFADVKFNPDAFLYPSEAIRNDVERAVSSTSKENFLLFSETLDEMIFTKVVDRPFQRFGGDQEELYLRSFSYLVGKGVSDEIRAIHADQSLLSLNIHDVELLLSGSFCDLSGYVIAFR